VSESWRKVVQSLVASAIVVSFVFAAAWLLSLRLPAIPKRFRMGLQLLGAFVTFWGGYAKVGWSIQTLGGTTPPEVFNERFFRVATGIGMFVLVLATFLDAKD